MDIKEAVRSVFKEFMLPELEGIKQEQREIRTAIELISRRLDDVNIHLADQSRRIDEVRSELSARIDETNKRIDETNKRIDEVRSELTTKIDEVRTELTGRIDEVRCELSGKIDEVKSDLTSRIDSTNHRIDQLTFQVGKVAQELERLKREEKVMADVLDRLRYLEKRVIGE
ncbi:paREP15, putative coiled-coil protein [Thermodesulfatator indicus DSM 15286]|uniref:PaREP15, putative coiled-coil protein n=1 Tax=Thermodesulfatator indicus (strain DSM 15286 / JCM 11887 / CIR29812) TaxID=667014 RepID=F8ABA9_THEID|nr:paREP15 coiled-coil protein [Thermodesulfatator indicus]AEH45571.1 paREP15, putative coiled-coil protein [Thermodesulfatator indicus DSM 15286]